MKEPTITIPLSVYNELVENQVKCVLPKAVKRKKQSKIKNFFRSLFSFHTSLSNHKLAIICINETYNVIYTKIMGYWKNCIDQDMIDGFSYFEETYKHDAYYNIMNKLNKIKSREAKH